MIAVDRKKFLTHNLIPVPAQQRGHVNQEIDGDHGKKIMISIG